MTLDDEDLTAIGALLDERDRPPRFLSASQLAELLGVDAASIYRRSDALGAIRVGSALRFELDDVVRRMRRNPEPAHEPVPRAPRRRPSRAGTVTLLPIRGGMPS